MKMKKYYPIRNPLTVITLFVGLTELTIGVYLSKAPTNYQTPLMWFLIIFSFIYLIGFFAVLFYRPQNFYGPGDFKNDENYVSLYKQIFDNTEEKNLATVETNGKEAEKAILPPSETGLENLVAHLDEKVCWYFLKVKDKELSFDEHIDILITEMQQSHPIDSYEGIRFIGYMHCLWSNFMNVLFKVRKADNEKFVLELESGMLELISKKLGLLQKPAG